MVAIIKISLRRFLLGVMLSMLCSFIPRLTLAVELSIDVDPSSGSLDDTFNFSVSIDGIQNSEYPRLEGGDDFEVTLVGPQSSVEIINGRFSARVTYLYTLKPKKEGNLATPSARVVVDGKELSAEGPSISVERPSVPKDFDSDERYSLRLTPSFRSVYVGEQLPVAIEIYSKEEVQEIKLDDVAFEGFWWSDMGELERGVKDFGKERFRVFRYRKALFPLRVGALELASQKATIVARERIKSSNRRSPDPFGLDPFGGSLFGDFLIAKPVQITLRSNNETIDVKPLPERAKDFPLAGLANVIVGKTEVRVDYNADQIKVGESKTLEYEIRSWGNINPLKELKLDLPQGLKLYQETPQLSQSEVSGRLYSILRVKLSLIPKQGGTVSIPPFRLGFFNPDTGEYEIAESAKVSFQVDGPIIDALSAAEEPKPSPQFATPQLTDSLRYEDQSALEKLSKQISLGLALLVLAIIVIIFALVSVVINLRGRASLKRTIRRELDSTRNLAEVNQVIRKLLKVKFNLAGDKHSSDELRAVMKREILDSATLFHALSLIDQLDLYSYGGKSAEDETFNKIKSQAMVLIEALG